MAPRLLHLELRQRQMEVQVVEAAGHQDLVVLVAQETLHRFRHHKAATADQAYGVLLEGLVLEAVAVELQLAVPTQGLVLAETAELEPHCQFLAHLFPMLEEGVVDLTYPALVAQEVQAVEVMEVSMVLLEQTAMPIKAAVAVVVAVAHK